MKKSTFVAAIIFFSTFSLISSCKQESNSNIEVEVKLNFDLNKLKSDVKAIVKSNMKKVEEKVSLAKKNNSVLNVRTLNPELLNIQFASLTDLSNDLPQFAFNSGLVTVNELENSAAAIGIDDVLNHESFPTSEKYYWDNVIAMNDQENFVALKTFILSNYNNVAYNSNLDQNSKDRIFFLFAIVEEIINNTESGSNLIVACDWKKIARGAIGSAVSSGLQGLYHGCKTGLVLGFNPGSAAAGCMGGLIVGMIGGAVIGTAVGMYGNC
jgi:hypothetical protein